MTQHPQKRPGQVQWQGKFLRVIKEGPWEYADRVGTTGAVAIVAVTHSGALLLTEQYRIPVCARVIELPAGLAGDEPGQTDEDLRCAAKRELREETGYEAGHVSILCSGPPSGGLASELVALVLASGLKRVGDGGGCAGEDIKVHEVPLTSVREWLEAKVAEGLLVDPKVYAGLYFLQR